MGKYLHFEVILLSHYFNFDQNEKPLAAGVRHDCMNIENCGRDVDNKP